MNLREKIVNLCAVEGVDISSREINMLVELFEKWALEMVGEDTWVTPEGASTFRTVKTMNLVEKYINETKQEIRHRIAQSLSNQEVKE